MTADNTPGQYQDALANVGLVDAGASRNKGNTRATQRRHSRSRRRRPTRSQLERATQSWGNTTALPTRPRKLTARQLCDRTCSGHKKHGRF